MSSCSPSASEMSNWFKSFYHGFIENATIWCVFINLDQFEFPKDFNFSQTSITEPSKSIFESSAIPCILPVGFANGRSHKPSYEFYDPSVFTRQLGLGQIPIGLFFMGKVKARDMVTTSSEYNSMIALNPSLPPLNLQYWIGTEASSELFNWSWNKWKSHIINKAGAHYHQRLFPSC